jgi:murein peptide amidase A
MGTHESSYPLVERAHRGVIRHEPSSYGQSRDGTGLLLWRPDGYPDILVMAAIHGDESETTVVLSEALRCIRAGDLRAAVILCANPDGMVRGTRGNALGVDVNRNFPTSNWSPDPVHYKSRESDARDIALSPGTEPASEPETKALLALIDELKPRAVVTLHSALACVDDAGGSLLGRRLAEVSGLPLQTDIGYPTPGSMGTWAGEQNLNLVTYELEPASPYELKDRHVPIMIDLMTGRIRPG